LAIPAILAILAIFHLFLILCYPFPFHSKGLPLKLAHLLRLLFVLLLSISANTQNPKLPPAPPQTPPAGETKVQEPPHEMTAADVQAFLDGFLPMQLERENIAGAVVCVVKDGKVLFAKGYGYSDVDKKKPVSVDDTLFRPGSISKLFTWTAVMQLVEQGKLDLDRDVNEYLDFKIPATYPQPITLRNIMTHTPGFEETIKELFVPEDQKMAPLREYLSRHMPRRIFPPGTVPAYSNYAATLAGYIVERVSGRPFNDYVTENIFKPLEMVHSTFAQPLPAQLKPLMSNGYDLGSGQAKPFEGVEPAPAGSLSSSATDISHFMIAHLQEGKFGNAEILRPETARQMHERQKGFHPEMNGMALGFYEETRNGHRIIGHGGDTIYFHSDLHLVLDAGLGFFISYNSAGKGEISGRTALWDHFLDRYFAYKPPDVAALSTAAADARTVSGYYMSTRRSQSTLLSAGNSFEEIHVVPDSENTIKVYPFKDFNGQTKRWREIGPLVYRAVNGQDRIAFQKDAAGRLELVVGFPAVAFQKTSWLDSQPWNRFVVYCSVGVILLVLILWPVAAVVRRHYGFRLDLTPAQRRWRLAIKLVCAIDMGFLVGVYLFAKADELSILSGKLDPWIILLELIALFGAIGTLLVIYATLRLWRAANVWEGVRWLNLMIVLACLGFTWFVIHWNIVNFNMNY
jgi:CubicO group peptidase (beta-lactamase class C family)